jgi:hypothetical protein
LESSWKTLKKDVAIKKKAFLKNSKKAFGERRVGRDKKFS